MGVTQELEEAQALLASGDVQGLLRCLRAGGESLPLGEVARLVADAARLAGFGDLAQAAAAAAGSGDPVNGDPQALYDYGYACIERGASYLAVGPLTRALELAPGSAPVLSELIAALEDEGQHERAIAVLEAHEPVLQWTHRYLYVYNALMAGSLQKAADGFARLPETADTAWRPAREKVRRMLARAGAVRTVTPLDRRDPRGWHYVLTGGILASLSPWGFDAGMTGRYAYLSDSQQDCADALRRLQLILGSARMVPKSVALATDSSHCVWVACLAGRPTPGLGS